MLNRLKRRVAEVLGLRRVFAATSYLLMRQLNADPMPEGPDGNRRLQEAFLDLFGVLQPTLFLDIGANDGAASLAVRRIAPACLVHAFEANPNIHAKHRHHLTEAGVTSWNLAISDQVGRITVYAPRTLSRAYVGGEVVPATVIEGEDTGKTSLLRRNEEATYDEFEVETTTLDRFVAAHVPDMERRSAFLWVDVEGAAERVLAGGGQLLSRTQAIFLETEGFAFWQEQSDSGALVNRLLRAGFLPVARDREYGDKQFNILFVHQDSIEPILPQLFDAQGPLRRCTGAVVGAAAAAAAPGAPASPVMPARPYISAGAALQTHIPVVIPCFNAVTYARGMVEQLRARGLRRLILLDNGSSYPPMLDYLAAPGPDVTVVASPTNHGPRHAFDNPSIFALLPEIFCLTDPDLVFNPAMPDDFIGQLAAVTEGLALGKAGLAIDIGDRAAMRQGDFRIGDGNWKIWDWERKFWEDEAAPLPGGDPVYHAPVDTTFAVYNKKYFDPSNFLKGVRVAGRFTCRHLPWYADNGLPAEEARFYRAHARDSYYLSDQAEAGAMPASAATVLNNNKETP